MNYETLGNTVPHLHTHLIPRFVADLNPGGPFPFAAAHAAATPIPDDHLEAEAAALRERLSTGT
jgi:diadenosine tetraphosphate (Ap4A) HIT family hydrolase